MKSQETRDLSFRKLFIGFFANGCLDFLTLSFNKEKYT